MKVLQVNCVYDYGSTGKLTKIIHNGLRERGIDSVVLYGRGKPTKRPNVYKTCTELEAKAWNLLSRFTGRPYSAAPLGTAALIRRIRREKPDVVHLQCINGFFVNIYTLIAWLKKHQIPTVLTLHADFMFTGGCSSAVDCNQWCSPQGCGSGDCPYFQSQRMVLGKNPSGDLWKRMKGALDGFGDSLTVVSVSPWLMERAQRSPILQGQHHTVILNGLDTDIFRVQDAQALRKLHGCEKKKVILHVTPQFSAEQGHLKGGYYVLELARRMPETIFLVAGKTDRKIQPPPNVILLGMILDQRQLARYYSMADVTLLTSKSESFSMVCAESLCCGTPVMGFKAGAPEQIALPEYSRFYAFGDLEGLCQGLRALERTGKRETIARQARQVYSKEIMLRKYLGVYDSMAKPRERDQ